MPKYNLGKTPGGEGFHNAVCTPFRQDIEVIDMEFNLLPSALKPEALQEALFYAFQWNKEPLLQWAYSRGLNPEKILYQDYGLALDIVVRMIRGAGKNPGKPFVEIARQAQTIHGQGFTVDALTATCLAFSDSDKGPETAIASIDRFEHVLGREAISNPDCASIVFKSVSSRSDHKEIIWSLARTSYLSDHLSSKATILALMSNVNEKDRAQLVKHLENGVCLAFELINDISEDEAFLTRILPFATPRILKTFHQKLLGRVSPLRHHLLSNTLLHGIRDSHLASTRPTLISAIHKQILDNPSCDELMSSFAPARAAGSTLWSLISTVEMINRDIYVTVPSHCYEEICKSLQLHQNFLTEHEKSCWLTLIKDNLEFDLKKTLKKALKEFPEPNHYLSRIGELPSNEQIDALVCLCAHEQLIIDQSHNHGKVEEKHIPLLTAARALVRNPGGNPHHSLRPLFNYLMPNIDDHFKIELRPKDKKYARELIMAGMISDTRLYALLTPKQREVKIGADLGL